MITIFTGKLFFLYDVIYCSDIIIIYIILIYPDIKYRGCTVNDGRFPLITQMSFDRENSPNADYHVMCVCSDRENNKIVKVFCLRIAE